MHFSFPLIAFACLALVNGVAVIRVSRLADLQPSAPLPPSFVSFSIEFSSFPDFAGRYISVTSTS